jgi:hypothetical protein
MKDLEIRCFCNRAPLLAVAGRDTKSGDGYIHIKSWKGNRLYTEVIVTSGVAHVRCRECFRWHTIKIVHTVSVTAEKLPDSIPV